MALRTFLRTVWSSDASSLEAIWRQFRSFYHPEVFGAGTFARIASLVVSSGTLEEWSDVCVLVLPGELELEPPAGATHGRLFALHAMAVVPDCRIEPVVPGEPPAGDPVPPRGASCGWMVVNPWSAPVAVSADALEWQPGEDERKLARLLQGFDEAVGPGHAAIIWTEIDRRPNRPKPSAERWLYTWDNH